MKPDWGPLRRELALWRQEGLTLPLWVRDDDAVTETAGLKRLLALAEQLGLPLHLAVIPNGAQKSLVDLCRGQSHARILVHGWQHANHAPEGQKKAEFGHPRTAMTEEAAAGLDRLREIFGAGVLPIFVPPWNRIDPGLTQRLPDLGYRALSTFRPREARRAAPGLIQINAHLDPIHWRGGGGLVPPEALIAQAVTLLQERRRGAADRAEPFGLLTHHLVHDEAIWTFTQSLLEELLMAGAVPCDLALGLP